MKPLLRMAAAIDRLNGAIGRFASWLVLLMILVGAFNAVARYLGRFVGQQLASNAYLELQWYLFSLIFLLGAAWTLVHDAHVRVDVLYGKLSDRGRSWINIVGTAVLLLPFCLFMLWVSWPSIRNSWRIREVSPNPDGLPVYPLKPFILVCFALLVIQGVAQLIKEIQEIRSGQPRPERPHAETLEGV